MFTFIESQLSALNCVKLHKLTLLVNLRDIYFYLSLTWVGQSVSDVGSWSEG